VEFRFGAPLIDLAQRDGRWMVRTTREEIEADAVILATGGRSVPTTGSDGAGDEQCDKRQGANERLHPSVPHRKTIAVQCLLRPAGRRVAAQHCRRR
jgi:predicted flavoprotein YhiN